MSDQGYVALNSFLQSSMFLYNWYKLLTYWGWFTGGPIWALSENWTQRRRTPSEWSSRWYWNEYPINICL